MHGARSSRFIGPRVKSRGELPSLLSERVWKPDLLDTWRPPDVVPQVKDRMVA